MRRLSHRARLAAALTVGLLLGMTVGARGQSACPTQYQLVVPALTATQALGCTQFREITLQNLTVNPMYVGINSATTNTNFAWLIEPRPTGNNILDLDWADVAQRTPVPQLWVYSTIGGTVPIFAVGP